MKFTKKTRLLKNIGKVSAASVALIFSILSGRYLLMHSEGKFRSLAESRLQDANARMAAPLPGGAMISSSNWIPRDQADTPLSVLSADSHSYRREYSFAQSLVEGYHYQEILLRPKVCKDRATISILFGAGGSIDLPLRNEGNPTDSENAGRKECRFSVVTIKQSPSDPDTVLVHSIGREEETKVELESHGFGTGPITLIVEPTILNNTSVEVR